MIISVCTYIVSLLNYPTPRTRQLPSLFALNLGSQNRPSSHRFGPQADASGHLQNKTSSCPSDQLGVDIRDGSTALETWKTHIGKKAGVTLAGALFNSEKYLTRIHEYSIFGSKSLSSMCCSLWQSCLRLWRWFTSTSSLLTFGPQICSQGRVKRQESASFITIAPQELMTKLFGFRLGTHTFED